MAGEPVWMTVELRKVSNGWVGTWRQSQGPTEQKVYTTKTKVHEDLTARLGL